MIQKIHILILIIFINIAITHTITPQQQLLQDKLDNKLKNKNKNLKSTELDVNTFCAYEKYNINGYKFDINLDFQDKKIGGIVELDIFTEVNDLETITLDVWDLQINKIQVSSLSHEKPLVDVEFDINSYPDSIQGSSLDIDVSKFWEDEKPIPRSIRIEVIIEYETDSENITQKKGFSFIDADKTLGGEQPFFYTQNEPIYMRSWMPSCDTPSIKSSWEGKVTVPSALKLFMSGSFDESVENDNSTTTYSYNNHHHLTPLYYLGVVVGDLEVEKLSERVNVIAEQHHLQDVVKQFTDVDKWISLAEEYLEFNYPWEIFQVVVMPPNYPFEGAAHPGLTYISPSLLVSEKEGQSDLMHQIASSFFGNLVSCSNWRNVWMNEGFAQYLERIIQSGFFGADYAHLDRFQGYYLMIDEMQDLYQGMSDTFASLHPDTKNRSPDEAFTLVPYEKGYQFLTYIEQLIGGIEVRKLLQSWVLNDQFRSVDWEDFQTFYDIYLKNSASEEAYRDGENIDWTSWIEQPGLPPKDTLKPFTSSEYDEVAELANKYIQFNGTAQPQNFRDLLSWNQLKITVFLDYFRAQKLYLTRRILIQLENNYKFQEMENMEISFRWLTLCAEVKHDTITVKQHTDNFLSETGRIKYLIPIYQAFVETGEEKTAISYLKKNQDFYHPIANDQLNKLIYGEDYDQK